MHGTTVKILSKCYECAVLSKFM